MNILALDFSSHQRSVAVLSAARVPHKTQGSNDTEASRLCPSLRTFRIGEVIESKNLSGPFQMIELALQQVQIEREQIDVVAVGLGPGSYTGIRSALAIAQGWQLASSSGPHSGQGSTAGGTSAISLLGISSSECIAAQAQADGFRGPATVVIDAQRNELYVAEYELDANGWREIRPLRLDGIPGTLARAEKEHLLVGPEVTRWFPQGKLVMPRAARLAEMALSRADYRAPEALEPIYLRETSFVKAPPPRDV